MTIAVTIGCYRLADFVRLNVRRCRRIFGQEVPILLSDDHSPESKLIQKIALEEECDYIVANSRRSHFSGDWQSVVNSAQFAKEIGAEIGLKLSQRVVPVLPEFRLAMERAFANPAVSIVVPGQLSPNQIARPTARFYRKFGVLSDAIALRVGSIEPTELLEIYRTRSREADNKKRPVSDSFSETTLGYLLDQKFPRSHVILPEWTHHRSGGPKLFLRKSQSQASEYAQVAAMEGLTDCTFDLREWIQIESREYRPKADVV